MNDQFNVSGLRMIEPLETARLSLRPVTLDDIDLVMKMNADPEVMAYLTGGKPSTRDEVVAMISGSLDSRWLAFENETTEFVGSFGIGASSPGEHELGYRLVRRAWGKGYATEGSLAVIRFAFDRLQATRVWAQTMFVNERSRAVMERCGLAYVRTFHEHFDDPIPGTEHGEVEYELLAPNASSKGRLIVICGMSGSGKTTLAKQIAEGASAIRLSADDWMVSAGFDVWNNEARDKVEAFQWQLAQDFLREGKTVVVEWGSWARVERDVLRNGARRLGARVELQYLDVDPDVIWQRIEVRGFEQRHGSRAVTNADITDWFSHLEPPTADEIALFDNGPRRSA